MFGTMGRRRGVVATTAMIAAALVGACGSDGPPGPGFLPAARHEPPRVLGAAPAPTPAPFEVPPPADPVVSIGRGTFQVCAVRASGAVDCWGGSPPDPGVRRVPGVTDARAISADAGCVLRRTGEVACFGGDPVALRPVPGLSHVTAVADRAPCFVVEPGAVTCLDDDDKPWVVPGIRDAVSIRGGTWLACIVRRSGRLACGAPGHAQPFQPVLGVDGVTEVALVDTSVRRVCVISRGALHCFGLTFPDDDTLPLRAQATDDGEPTELPDRDAFAGATELSAWLGDPDHFVLEARIGGVVRRFEGGTSAPIPLLTDAVAHVPGCALRAQGSVVCWGSNRGGALGQPTTLGLGHAAPAKVLGVTDVVGLALGTIESWALTRDGRVFRWGSEGWDDATYARQVPLGLGPTDLIQIVANPDGFLCMRSASGDVWCQTEGSHPRRIEPLDTAEVTGMSTTWRSVVVWHAEGGAEEHVISGYIGQLEPRELDVADAAEVRKVSDDVVVRARGGGVTRLDATLVTHATAMVTGSGYACALQDGAVWCATWDYDRKTTPTVQLPGIRDAVQIAGAPDRVCAIHGRGRVSCWALGETAFGAPVEALPGGAVELALGWGTEAQRTSVILDGPGPGGELGCAILADRTVTCWGTNLFGELGDGSVVESATPIGVRL